MEAEYSLDPEDVTVTRSPAATSDFYIYDNDPTDPVIVLYDNDPSDPVV